jgi:hypothetical protein
MVDGAILIKYVYECDGASSQGADSAPAAFPPRDSDWDAICVRTAIALGENVADFCDLPQGAAPPTLTPGMVAAAFRRLPLPPSPLIVQPPDGKTLVNFATNFYTDNAPFTRTVTLLGQRVDLRITPSRFGWVFGDGATTATTTPGSPFPHLDVTHDYLRAGQVGPRVDTTYTARFSVNGGPWRPVAGSVTIPGSPVDLRVVEATPELVAYR